MVPDYGLIVVSLLLETNSTFLLNPRWLQAEIILYSEGFNAAKMLAGPQNRVCNEASVAVEL